MTKKFSSRFCERFSEEIPLLLPFEIMSIFFFSFPEKYFLSSQCLKNEFLEEFSALARLLSVKKCSKNRNHGQKTSMHHKMVINDKRKISQTLLGVKSSSLKQKIPSFAFPLIKNPTK